MLLFYWQKFKCVACISGFSIKPIISNTVVNLAWGSWSNRCSSFWISVFHPTVSDARPISFLEQQDCLRHSSGKFMKINEWNLKKLDETETSKQLTVCRIFLFFHWFFSGASVHRTFWCWKTLFNSRWLSNLGSRGTKPEFWKQVLLKTDFPCEGDHTLTQNGSNNTLIGWITHLKQG